MERKDWKKGQQNKFDSKRLIEHTYPFKDIWLFEVEPAGWVLNPNKDKKARSN